MQYVNGQKENALHDEADTRNAQRQMKWISTNDLQHEMRRKIKFISIIYVYNTHTYSYYTPDGVYVCERWLLFIFAHLRCLSDGNDALREAEAETSCEKLLCAAFSVCLYVWLCVWVSMSMPVPVCVFVLHSPWQRTKIKSKIKIILIFVRQTRKKEWNICAEYSEDWQSEKAVKRQICHVGLYVWLSVWTRRTQLL